MFAAMVGFSREGPSRRAGRDLQLWGSPRRFSSPLPAAGFALVLPRFTLPPVQHYFRRKGLWQKGEHVCLGRGRENVCWPRWGCAGRASNATYTGRRRSVVDVATMPPQSGVI